MNRPPQHPSLARRQRHARRHPRATNWSSSCGCEEASGCCGRRQGVASRPAVPMDARHVPPRMRAFSEHATRRPPRHRTPWPCSHSPWPPQTTPSRNLGAPEAAPAPLTRVVRKCALPHPHRPGRQPRRSLLPRVPPAPIHRLHAVLILLLRWRFPGLPSPPRRTTRLSAARSVRATVRATTRQPYRLVSQPQALLMLLHTAYSQCLHVGPCLAWR